MNTLDFHAFLLVFIPLFVAVDAFGVLPMYIGMIDDLEKKTIRRILLQSLITAFVVGIAFLAVGNKILNYLGISIADFMIAGGVVLFTFSIVDLLFYEKRHRTNGDAEAIGAVPIGVPLIVGPAVLTTGILLVRESGFLITSISLSLNILIAGIIFFFAEAISKVLGKTGARVISKLASLLLCAYGVMMVRKGLMLYF